MGTVRYLLDTHALLWAARDETKLSNTALSVIEDSATPIYISAVSAFDILPAQLSKPHY